MRVVSCRVVSCRVVSCRVVSHLRYRSSPNRVLPTGNGVQRGLRWVFPAGGPARRRAHLPEPHQGVLCGCANRACVQGDADCHPALAGFHLRGSSVFDYFGILPAVFKVAGGTLLFTFSAQLIGSNSDKADKMMHEDDEPQQHQQQPVLTAVAKHDEDTLAIPETSATKGPPVAPSPEDHSCGKLCRWMIALPRAVRSQSVSSSKSASTPRASFFLWPCR